ncbi:kinase-like protein [Parathielavia appendiculata]|uniref:Kinase-like protein n=1 Tax=Parathielavia appendiculata TaxID=2587402 RepID=A0AAN6YZW0_9PEZI|nr:kinase-like protein [Parathielavia appendiculata]
MAKCILKQSLQALDFLHDNGIAHGDLHPENILFALNEIDSKSKGRSDKTKTLDAKQDKWAPCYLCIPQSLATFTSSWPRFQGQVFRHGGAYFLMSPPARPVTPLGLRAPELILCGTVSKTLYIWAWGCVVSELVTGEPLFCVPGDGFEDDEHLPGLIEQLSPLPDESFQKRESSSLYFTPDGRRFNSLLDGVAGGEEPLVLEQETVDERSKVKSLLRRVLQYD